MTTKQLITNKAPEWMWCKQPKLKQKSSHAYRNQPKKDNSALLIQGPENTWFLKIFPFQWTWLNENYKNVSFTHTHKTYCELFDTMEHSMILNCNKTFRHNKMWYFLRDHMKDMYTNENSNHIPNCTVSNSIALTNTEHSYNNLVNTDGIMVVFSFTFSCCYFFINFLRWTSNVTW